MIAAPTNLLKDEIYEKAKKLGLDVRKTPSLEQIKDKMPSKIWKKIQHFHAIGQHGRVHSYIIEVLEKENIPCYVSLEERMGCGIGACLVCVCDLTSGKKSRVCKDGPVFNSKAVQL